MAMVSFLADAGLEVQIAAGSPPAATSIRASNYRGDRTCQATLAPAVPFLIRMEDEMGIDACAAETNPEPRVGRSVSLDHAAELLGVSRRTIYTRIREGRLQTIRTIGGSQRVRLESVGDSRNARVDSSLRGSSPSHRSKHQLRGV